MTVICIIPCYLCRRSRSLARRAFLLRRAGIFVFVSVSQESIIPREPEYRLHNGHTIMAKNVNKNNINNQQIVSHSHARSSHKRGRTNRPTAPIKTDRHGTAIRQPGSGGEFIVSATSAQQCPPSANIGKSRSEMARNNTLFRNSISSNLYVRPVRDGGR